MYVRGRGPHARDYTQFSYVDYVVFTKTFDSSIQRARKKAKRAREESIYTIAWCISPPTNLIYLCAAFMFWQFVSFQLYHKCMHTRRTGTEVSSSSRGRRKFFRRETFSLAHCDFVLDVHYPTLGRCRYSSPRIHLVATIRAPPVRRKTSKIFLPFMSQFSFAPLAIFSLMLPADARSYAFHHFY